MTAASNGQRSHWAGFNEVSFVAGMRLLFWICRVFGRWPFRVVLYPVLAWYVLTNARARRVSRAYLRRVAACGGAEDLRVLRHFGSFAESILDKMLLWGGLFDTHSVSLHGVDGADGVNRCLDEGRGALLICAHLGNLDLCRVLSQRNARLKLTVLVHTRHAQAFNRMLERLNPDSQLNLMQVTEMTPATAMLLAEKVAQGEFVVIAGDRIPVSPQPRVAVAPFLGQPAAFPIGPYVLASVLQCPVYLLFSMRSGQRSEVHFELFRESLHLPRKAREAMLAELAADYAARLQYHCLRSPLEWFNFYDFWQLPDTSRLDTPDASR
ncbi:acyltransferase [Janthinobacterium sp. BJB1]|uniref:LpxL/LpxP family acyltransferase n=1 Tax=Janthinobacterium sp. GW458P TaxID=1981504 RepID=UPI000A32155D|nr:acyltransferase [Janthinobacterium sp. GW458P]MBE3023115.1 acyltransferase [Janthinobacterium sp. GW458P]PHV16380.1 acyltransferase [Janthinobacterium sp. BJB303]PJC95985.1 acyltransferase [Janthinobacterium sp. BJB1]